MTTTPATTPPSTDPVDQLLHSIAHARTSLDRVDQAITNLPQEAIDALYNSPLGRHLEEVQSKLRLQLALFAKQYIALGIEDRKTRQLEDWTNFFIPIITAMMSDPDIGLTPKQRKQLPSTVERHIHLLETTSG
jgi:hypothetical protein